MNIIIPLCGKGERFSRAGYKNAKPLIKVVGKEIIRHVLDSLQIGDEDNLYIIINHRIANSGFKSFISRHYPKAQIIELEKETRGASETLQVALPHIVGNKGCLLVDGDNFYTHNIVEAIKASPNTNQIVCFETHGENPVFSYISFDAAARRVTAIAEKQKISNYANTGAYYFSSVDLLQKAVDDALFAVCDDKEPYISHAIATTLSTTIWQPLIIPADQYISLGTPAQVDNYIKRTYGCLFDLDGTLVNTDAAYFRVWSEILAEYNITLTKEIYDTYIYSNDDTSVKHKLLGGISITLSDLSNKKDSLFLKYLDDVCIISGAKEFIVALKRQAHAIAVVTNSNRRTAEAILNHIDIQPDLLIIGSECVAAKPAPDPYLNAIAELGLEQQQCIVFEDSKTGITSGKSANVRCVVGIGKLAESGGADCVYLDYKSLSFNAIINMKKPEIDYANIIYNSLKNKYKVSNIVISPIQLKGGFIADVLSVKLLLDDRETHAVMKLMNENTSALNQMAHFLDLYDRENFFYESIASYVPVHVPRCYGLLRDSTCKVIGFLLEDMRASGAVINKDLSKEPIDLSLSVISNIACLHAKFWRKNLETHFRGIHKHNNKTYQPAWKDFLSARIDTFLSKWSAILKPSHATLARSIVDNFNSIQDALSAEPLTLVHGDVKSPNIFYMGDTPCFIDWQYIAHGKGVQDIVFFMIESFSPERMKHLYPLFKNYYYVKLLEYGVTDYSFAEYEKDWINAMYYFPFFVAVWFGTTPNSDLIDVNFPYFFIQRLFAFYDFACCGDPVHPTYHK